MTTTVIMPTWNQAKFLEEAVESVLAQSSPLELIVVVDGRQPESEAILQRYAGRLTVKLLDHNQGTAVALNTGFAAADPLSEFWTWVSSDNVMYPSWLERLRSYLETHLHADAVYSAYLRDHGKKQVRCGQPFDGLIQSQNCYIGPSFLYRAALGHRVGEHRGRICHDYDWWLRAEEAGTIEYLDEPLCLYRVHRERATVLLRHEYDAPHWQAEARERRLQQ